MPNPNGLVARREGGKVIIEISEDNFIFAINNHPAKNLKITDREAFLNGFVENVCEFQARSSGFDDQPDLVTLIDNIAEGMCESAHPGIAPADE